MEKVSRVKIFGLDKKSLEEATQRGDAEQKRLPLAYAYSPKADELRFTMPSGARVAIPRNWIEEFRDFTVSEMRKVELGFFRQALVLDERDAHISVMGLLRDAVMGDDPYARAGRVTSPAKRRAARRNGAKGGRPRKKARR